MDKASTEAAAQSILHLPPYLRYLKDRSPGIYYMWCFLCRVCCIIGVGPTTSLMLELLAEKVAFPGRNPCAADNLRLTVGMVLMETYLNKKREQSWPQGGAVFVITEELTDDFRIEQLVLPDDNPAKNWCTVSQSRQAHEAYEQLTRKGRAPSRQGYLVYKWRKSQSLSAPAFTHCVKTISYNIVARKPGEKIYVAFDCQIEFIHL